jgi:hypothetical protein
MNVCTSDSILPRVVVRMTVHGELRELTLNLLAWIRGERLKKKEEESTCGLLKKRSMIRKS